MTARQNTPIRANQGIIKSDTWTIGLTKASIISECHDQYNSDSLTMKRSFSFRTRAKNNISCNKSSLLKHPGSSMWASNGIMVYRLASYYIPLQYIKRCLLFECLFFWRYAYSFMSQFMIRFCSAKGFSCAWLENFPSSTMLYTL